MTANNEPAADLTEKDRAFRAFVREENVEGGLLCMYAPGPLPELKSDF